MCRWTSSPLHESRGKDGDAEKDCGYCKLIEEGLLQSTVEISYSNSKLSAVPCQP